MKGTSIQIKELRTKFSVAPEPCKLLESLGFPSTQKVKLRKRWLETRSWPGSQHHLTSSPLPPHRLEMQQSIRKEQNRALFNQGIQFIKWKSKYTWSEWSTQTHFFFPPVYFTFISLFGSVWITYLLCHLLSYQSSEESFHSTSGNPVLHQRTPTADTDHTAQELALCGCSPSAGAGLRKPLPTSTTK